MYIQYNYCGQEMQTLLDYYKQMKILMTSTTNEEISKIDQLVILIHSVNSYKYFQCLNDQNQKCQYPTNWNKQRQGVYRMKYQIKKGQQKGKITQFRIVNKNDGVSVNFVIENQHSLYSCDLNLNEKEHEIINKYQKYLEGILKQQVPERNNQIQLQGRQTNNREDYRFTERSPFMVYPNNREFNRIGQGQQYVGPNSRIFGNETNNLRVGNNNRRPIGARWDPVDPFNSDLDPGNDFFGFNQQGFSSSGRKGPFGPNGNRFI